MRIRALFASALLLVGFSAHAGTIAPLLTPQALKTLIDKGEVRVLDIRAGKAANGQSLYAAGHIHGAVETPYGQFRGPQENPGELPSEAKLSQVLQKAGVNKDPHVVVAAAGSDSTDFGAAARVYWTLKVAGLTHLSILEGGVQDWKAAGLPLGSDAVAVSPSKLTVKFDQSQIVTQDEIAASLKSGKSQTLLDARPKSFFDGEARHDGAARYGTLPGARDLDYNVWFQADGRHLKPVAELKQIAQRQGAAQAPAVSFCNTGHWAATNWFVLSELVGNKNVKLYPESMVAWSKSNLPMDNQPSRVKALLQDARR